MPAPLVLLHGVGASRTIWDLVVPRLAAEREVLALDLPGFGAEPPVGDGFVLEEVADAVAARLPGAPVDLVGHSLGGAVAIVLAARHPERVARLVLVAPAGLAPAPGALAAAAGAVAAPAVELRRELGRAFAERASARRLMFGATVADAGALHPDAARLMLDSSAGAARVAAGVREALRADLRDDLAATGMPVGIVWGEADRVVAHSGLPAVAGLREGAVVATLPGTGHVPQVERPAAFAAALERVLAELPAT